MIKISLKFVPKGPIQNIPALGQIMTWCHQGNKALSKSMMVSLLTHICQWEIYWTSQSIARLLPPPGFYAMPRRHDYQYHDLISMGINE